MSEDDKTKECILELKFYKSMCDILRNREKRRNRIIVSLLYKHEHNKKFMSLNDVERRSSGMNYGSGTDLDGHGLRCCCKWCLLKTNLNNFKM